MKRRFEARIKNLGWLLGLLLISIPAALVAQEKDSGGEGRRNSGAKEGGDSVRVIRDIREIRSGIGRRTAREVVEFGRDVTIGPNEVLRDVVVIAGNVKIDGRVERDVVVVSGSAEVNGEVEGSLVVVLGATTLGPDSRIGREAVVIGGPFLQDEMALIDGERVFIGLNHALPSFDWLQQWLSNGLFLARPLPPQFAWVWVIAGLFLALHLTLTLLFPQPVRASVMALQERPVSSFFAGVLLLILFGPLMFLLIISIAGVLVIPFLICATILAFLFGKAAVYSYAGRQVTRQTDGANGGLILPMLVGAVLFYLLYMVPVLGFLVWAVVTLLGLGAVVLAAVRSLQREGASGAVAAPPVVVMRAPGAIEPGSVPGTTPAGSLPQGDVIVMPRVGFWRRFVATTLDFVLLCLLITVSGPTFVLIWAGYHVAMWAWKGTTIGGIVVGIKVVRLNGSPVDFSVALVRSLASFFSALVFFLGFFWAGWDREKQAWHDKIAGTLVVLVPKNVSLI